MVRQGDRDVYGGQQIGRRAVELLPDGRLEVIPGGHAPFLDDPERCGTLISESLQQTAGVNVPSAPPASAHGVETGGSPGFTAPRHRRSPSRNVLGPASNDGERHADALQLDAVLERREIVLPET